jgi:hypothetical protein
MPWAWRPVQQKRPCAIAREIRQAFRRGGFSKTPVCRSTLQSDRHAMGAVGESGFLSRKYGAHIGISNFGNLHAFVSDQHDILSAGPLTSNRRNNSPFRQTAGPIQILHSCRISFFAISPEIAADCCNGVKLAIG